MIRRRQIIFLCFILLLLLHISMLLDHRQTETISKYICQLEGLYYVGHLESKERLCIQPVQLFHFS